MNFPYKNSSSFLHLCWYQAQLVWAKITHLQILALGSFGLWLAIILLVNRPLITETANLKSHLQLAQTTHSKNSTSQPIIKSAAPLPTEDSVPAAFIRFLPALSKQKEHLVLLHQLADQSGLILRNTHYQDEGIKTIPAQQLLLQLKMEGKESGFRLFLHTILNKLPNLGISNIALEKAANQQDNTNISLTITMYYRK